MSQYGQRSPDGRYWWDGQQWVPIPAAAPPLPPQRSHTTRNLVIVAVVVGVLLCGGLCTAVVASRPSSSPTPLVAAPASAAATKAPTGAATSPSPAAPKFFTFGEGTQRVGQDVQPGTYRTRKAASGCYWSRLKGFSGQLGDILANEIADGPQVVTIAPEDKGFTSSRCGTWSADLSSIVTTPNSFGEGTFIVSTDVQPGTYRSSGGSGCYWARLRGFSGTLSDVAANDLTDTPAVVTIAAGDKGFKSSKCGTWSKS